MLSSRAVRVTVKGNTYYAPKRYDFKASKLLGRGGFGMCCTAYDCVENRTVAIKKYNAHSEDHYDLLLILRELKLMKLLGPHPNVLNLYALYMYPAENCLTVVMEQMDCDLHRVITSNQPLSEPHVKCFLKQILEGIKEIHALGLVLCQLQPSRILVSRDCQLRIKCVRSARQAGQVLESEDLGYRWYRAPEQILAADRPINVSGDLHSVGCILAELLIRSPMFPGESHLKQIDLVLGYNGLSSLSELGYEIPSDAASYLTKHLPYTRAPRDAKFANCSSEVLSLLDALLAVNPSQRPTAEEALQHPFLADAEVLHDYSKQYLTRSSPDFFTFEHPDTTIEQLREELSVFVELVTPVDTTCEEDSPLFFPLSHR